MNGIQVNAVQSRLVKCPACGRAVSPNAAACPACAEPIRPERTNHSGINLRDPVHVVGVIIAALVVAATVVFAVSKISSDNQENRNAVDMIKYQNKGGLRVN